MSRPAWLLVGGVLALAGYDLILRGWMGSFAWLVAGVGGGLVWAVLTSLVYDGGLRSRARAHSRPARHLAPDAVDDRWSVRELGPGH